MWNHAQPKYDHYHELGVSRGFEPNQEKITDPTLKTVTPAGVILGGSYMYQYWYFNTKIHSDPATSFWLGLSTISQGKSWGFTAGLDLSFTPWPHTYDIRTDEIEGLGGIEYPVVIERTGNFSAWGIPMQFEWRPSKYFVPIFSLTPVSTGVSDTSSVELVEPFDQIAEYDGLLALNLERKRAEEAEKDGASRYMLVGGLGFRSQFDWFELKFTYTDRRLDSFHKDDNFQQFFRLAFGVSTGKRRSAKGKSSKYRAPPKSTPKPTPSPSPSPTR